jgi:hypothetical protein
MLVNHCELELRIEWLDKGRYFITARFSYPARDLEDQLLDPVEIEFDFNSLSQLAADPEGYGKQLSAMVFGFPGSKVFDAYSKARNLAASQSTLRVRLSIPASAPELHSLAWELMLDPLGNQPLLMQENLWFSRFLASQDYRAVTEGDSTLIKALLVVASPSDVATKWKQGEIDHAKEVARALLALEAKGQTSGRRIVASPLQGPATLLNIVSTLNSANVDILYLVCHGALIDGHEPRLLLEADDGSGHSIAGQELVDRLRDNGRQPRLIVLASCESAGSQHEGVMNAIGPRLAAVGVPAVLAMQGKITQETSALFMASMLKELADSGQIDRAVAVGRSLIRARPDWWMPTLFMRLKTGRLWQTDLTSSVPFDKWPALALDIEGGQFVPILGPGLVESQFGSTRSMAKKWAERYEFPLAPRNRDDLAQVAQYLSYRQSRKYAFAELRKYLISQVRERFETDLKTAGLRLGKDFLNCELYEGLLNEMMVEVGTAQRANNRADVHRLLARLPLNVFVNANRDNLLRDALIEQGKKPQVQLCTWRVFNDMPQQIGPVPAKGYVPSVQEPLVFHVFGNLEHPESLVLTEDDYFDFLTAVTRAEFLKKLGIPGSVSSAFAASGWLLLGFQPDDWDFRVLLRGILKQPGNRQGEQSVRVAVQINPSEGAQIDPDRATKYIDTFFQTHGKMTTFWGTPEAFMSQLVAQCEADSVIKREGA